VVPFIKYELADKHSLSPRERGIARVPKAIFDNN
jgi:hypothetical protein